MKNFLATIKNSTLKFARDEEGAQIVEYALIIAVISLALIAAMTSLTNTDFTTWVNNVGTCLRTGTCP